MTRIIFVENHCGLFIYPADLVHHRQNHRSDGKLRNCKKVSISFLHIILQATGGFANDLLSICLHNAIIKSQL